MNDTSRTHQHPSSETAEYWQLREEQTSPVNDLDQGSGRMGQTSFMADPDRWKVPSELAPSDAPILDDPMYHLHPMLYLTRWWTLFPWSPGPCPFTSPFLDLLDRLHGVWTVDEDPRAMKMTGPDPRGSAWDQVEDAPLRGAETDPSTGRRLFGDQLLIVLWRKALLACETVRAHLEATGQLSDQDAFEVEKLRVWVADLEANPPEVFSQL